MKKLLVLLLLVTLGVEIGTPAFARRVVVARGPHRRTAVVVRRGWPLRRPLPVVVVRPARAVVRVAPVVYLTPVVWPGAVILTRPAPDVLVWQDGETIAKDEDWTEITLNAGSRGRKLYLEIASGKAQLNFAEVVFGNGEARVVDFSEKTRGPGLYSLLDFADGRQVDHVRLVARARSGEARIVLRMEK